MQYVDGDNLFLLKPVLGGNADECDIFCGGRDDFAHFLDILGVVSYKLLKNISAKNMSKFHLFLLNIFNILVEDRRVKKILWEV